MMKMALGCIKWLFGRTLGKQVGAQWRFEPAKQSDPDAAANTVLCPPIATESGWWSARGRMVLIPGILQGFVRSREV